MIDEKKQKKHAKNKGNPYLFVGKKLAKYSIIMHA